MQKLEELLTGLEANGAEERAALFNLDARLHAWHASRGPLRGTPTAGAPAD